MTMATGIPHRAIVDSGSPGEFGALSAALIWIQVRLAAGAG
jgi:hypothetical protein